MKKLRNNHGLTLMEVLVSVLIIALLALAMGTGMSSGLQIYKASTFHSNCETLAGVIDTTLDDLLRHCDSVKAYEITGEGEEAAKSVYIFTNLPFGAVDSYVYADETTNGTLRLKSTREKADLPLLNAGAYPDLKIYSLEVQYVSPETGENAGSDLGGYFVANYVLQSTTDENLIRGYKTVIRHLNTGKPAAD